MDDFADTCSVFENTEATDIDDTESELNLESADADIEFSDIEGIDFQTPSESDKIIGNKNDFIEIVNESSYVDNLEINHFKFENKEYELEFTSDFDKKIESGVLIPSEGKVFIDQIRYDNIEQLWPEKNIDYVENSKTGEHIKIYGEIFDREECVSSVQGINNRHFKGTCGLVSSANVINIAEDNRVYTDRITENDIVDFAIENNCCEVREDQYESGGTQFEDIAKILNEHNIENTIYKGNKALNLDEISQEIKDGKIIIMAVDAKDIWCTEDETYSLFRKKSPANHAITITGAVENPETKVIDGFIITDSGRRRSSDKRRYITKNDLERAYEGRRNRGVIVTEQSYSAR